MNQKLDGPGDEGETEDAHGEGEEGKWMMVHAEMSGEIAGGRQGGREGGRGGEMRRTEH
jgi:hypothetical protein